jgi:hypothetical protein
MMVQLRWQVDQQGVASGRPGTLMTGDWHQGRLLFQWCHGLLQVQQQQQQPQPQGMVLHT